MDDKREKYIFIGFKEISKYYKLYSPDTGKIIINRNVIFDEEGEWDWRLSNENYNFFIKFEEDGVELEERRENLVTPSTSPTMSSEKG